MATNTLFLQLVLPLNTEFADTWDQPMNENFTRIDTWASGINLEIVNARFTKTNLAEFLAVGHESDGTIKSPEELVGARNSQIYGDEDGSSNDLDVPARLDLGDKEVFDAREGSPSLRDALAIRSLLADIILDGAMDVNNQPTWLGFTAADFQIDGSSDELKFLIGGKLSRVRTLEQVTISGAAQTYFLFAQFEADGKVRLDGDSGAPPPASPAGITGSDGNKNTIFTDATNDFTTKDIQPNDILTILGNTSDSGVYLIKEVAPGGNTDQLKIVGIFPQGGLSSLDYTVSDPTAVTLGVDAVETPASGKLYIGEADFDGAAITAIRPRQFKDVFVGDWRSVDVGSSDFTEIWNHFFGDVNLDFSVQVSQSDDGSTPVEEMDIGSTLANTLGVNIVDGHVYNQGSFDPGTGDSTYTDGTLTGAVTGNLTGTILPENSVKMKWDKNKVFVKNTISGVFYKDFDDVTRVVGFIRVIARKRI